VLELHNNGTVEWEWFENSMGQGHSSKEERMKLKGTPGIQKKNHNASKSLMETQQISMKVVLIGGTGVGKSFMCMRMSSGKSMDPAVGSSTIGAQFFRKEM